MSDIKYVDKSVSEVPITDTFSFGENCGVPFPPGYFGFDYFQKLATFYNGHHYFVFQLIRVEDGFKSGVAHCHAADILPVLLKCREEDVVNLIFNSRDSSSFSLVPLMSVRGFINYFFPEDGVEKNENV